MIKNLTGILFLAALSPFHLSATDYVSLDELQKQGKISFSIEGVGGFQEECVQLIVTNFSRDSIHGMVPAGRKLNSLNDSEQDILVVKTKRMSIAPGKTDTVNVYGFCCQSDKKSPKKNSAFSFGVMAPVAWLILTNITDLFNFPPSAIQNAIWVLSNNHDIRSIPAYSNPQADQLRHAVANILDIELPWYSFQYAQDQTDLFTDRKTHLFAEVLFTIPYQALISAQITDKWGNTVYEAYAGSFKAGNNVLSVSVPIETWAVDDYYLFINEDFHTTNKRLKFTLKDNAESEE
jgi:hypothetical protein